MNGKFFSWVVAQYLFSIIPTLGKSIKRKREEIIISNFFDDIIIFIDISHFYEFTNILYCFIEGLKIYFFLYVIHGKSPNIIIRICFDKIK